jgi:hypothetical protein
MVANGAFERCAGFRNVSKSGLGRVAERFKAPVLKTGIPARVS